jgi:hypothetical protein
VEQCQPTLLTGRSTLRNALESPLLRLPVEIRLRIYEYAVGGHIVCWAYEGYWAICAVWGHDPTATPCHLFGDGTPPHFVKEGMPTGICRQIRSESIHCLFKSNIFLLGHPDTMWRFEKSICSAAQTAAIQEISLGSAGSKYIEAVDREYQKDGSFGGYISWRGINMATTFPSLKRLFISPVMLSHYPAYAAMPAADLVVALVGCELPGVDVVFLDVLDPKAKFHEASIVRIPAAK